VSIELPVTGAEVWTVLVGAPDSMDWSFGSFSTRSKYDPGSGDWAGTDNDWTRLWPSFRLWPWVLAGGRPVLRDGWD
jgi:hypothetical protein